jgi:hypothetical protein
MEMTIYRGRWQEHLKTRGEYYMQMAKELEELSKKNNETGAYEASLALKALANILEECRINKLTRHQYVTFVLGRLISMAEHSYIFSKTAMSDKLSETVKFDLPTYRAMARVFAKNTALKIAIEGGSTVLGFNESSAKVLDKINLSEIEKRQYGILSDMEMISSSLVQVFKSK